MKREHFMSLFCKIILLLCLWPSCGFSTAGSNYSYEYKEICLPVDLFYCNNTCDSNSINSSDVADLDVGILYQEMEKNALKYEELVAEAKRLYGLSKELMVDKRRPSLKQVREDIRLIESEIDELKEVLKVQLKELLERN